MKFDTEDLSLVLVLTPSLISDICRKGMPVTVSQDTPGAPSVPLQTQVRSFKISQRFVFFSFERFVFSRMVTLEIFVKEATLRLSPQKYHSLACFLVACLSQNIL